MKLLQDCLLYGIVDLGYVAPPEVGQTADRLVQGGIDLLQLRGKGAPKQELARLAEVILTVTKPAEVPLIINDYPDLLQEVDAEGCHVGQDDLSIHEARELAGRPCLVGRSTHSINQAKEAEAESADYIGFGPLFATATKPGAKAIGLHDLRELHATVSLPIFCIGGVKLSNLPEIQEAGAKRVCMVSDLLLAPEVAQRVGEVKKILGRLG